MFERIHVKINLPTVLKGTGAAARNLKICSETFPRNKLTAIVKARNNIKIKICQIPV